VRDEVFRLKDTWHVCFQGKTLPTQWAQRGAAQTYLEILREKQRKLATQNSRETPKDLIIAGIEEDRGGTAFDDDVVTVLKKVSQADIFVLQKAFMETFRLGVKKGQDA